MVIGFAAETNDVEAQAKAKLARKGCDLIVANDVSAASGIMGGDHNQVLLVAASGVTHWPRMDKGQVAQNLIAHFAEMLNGAAK